MHREMMGKQTVINGEFHRVNDHQMLSVLHFENAIYEVVRVVDGTLLFFQDHYQRLCHSHAMSGSDYPMESFALIQKEAYMLVEKSQTPNFNIKIVLCFGKNQGRYRILYGSPYYYPSREEYKTGVPTCISFIERKVPNKKSIDFSYRGQVTKKMSDVGVFETLLVNKEGFLTEGSRSNLFLVLNEKVCTAPGDMVLKGITRKYIFDFCRKAGIPLEEKPIHIDGLDQCGAAFLSGTSINVMPISHIDQTEFESASNRLVREIMKGFDLEVEAYINHNREVGKHVQTNS